MPTISLKTEHPVAYESPDHIHPWGTKRDLSRQLRFEGKLCQLMEVRKYSRVMDLGCSGGSFIVNMHDLGFIAVGLEGSDYSKQRRRGPWAFLSDHVLFTCDITKEFNLVSDKRPMVFDVVTSFEVLEHLAKDQLKSLFENIESHTHENSILIFSVGTADDYVDGINLHQTVENKDWWRKRFEEFGWEACRSTMSYLNGQYLRGKKFGAESSFEIVLRRKGATDLPVPHLSLGGRFIDMISGSRLQRMLFDLVHGGRVYNSY